MGYWNELAGFGWLLASATSGASGLVTVTGSQKRFPRGRLGRRPAVWGILGLAGRWLLYENGEFERIRPHLMPLECGIIFDGIPEGAIPRKVGLIWGIPD